MFSVRAIDKLCREKVDDDMSRTIDVKNVEIKTKNVKKRKKNVTRIKNVCKR